jgi:hypothetical protein
MEDRSKGVEMGHNPGPREGQIILYSTPEGAAKIEVHFEDETFWLTQKRIAELFGVEVHTISYHLKEIVASGELVREATLRRSRRVPQEGSRAVSRDIVKGHPDSRTVSPRVSLHWALR